MIPSDPQVLALWAGVWAAAILATVAAVHDLKTREIPDWISIALGALGCGIGLVNLNNGGLKRLVLGVAVATGACLLLALLKFRGGDLKLLLGVGAAVGHPGIWIALIGMVLAGGVIGAWALARGKNEKIGGMTEIPYGPAIAAGALMTALLMELRR